MKTFSLNTGVIAAAVLTANAAVAAPVIYDETAFNFTYDGWTSPTASVSGDVNGLTIEFTNLSAYASSYDSFVPYYSEAIFEGSFDFSNYSSEISGFTYTVYGTYDIESPGDVYFSVNYANAFSSSESVSNSTFSASGNITSNAYLDLRVLGGATSDDELLEVITGYRDVFSHYETVLLNPGCDDITIICQYSEEAVYIEEPIISYQMDLGSSSLTIDRIEITPQEVPVPAAAWLFGSAIAGLLARKQFS